MTLGHLRTQGAYAYSVRRGGDWEAIALGLHEVGAIAESSSVLGELWLGQWELHSGKRFADEVEVVAQEIQADLQLCRDLEPDQGACGYNDAVEALEAYRPEQRGSGTKTSILAALGHGGVFDAGATLEERIKSKSRGGTAFADLVWKPRVLIEMKRRGED